MNRVTNIVASVLFVVGMLFGAGTLAVWVVAIQADPNGGATPTSVRLTFTLGAVAVVCLLTTVGIGITSRRRSIRAGG